MESYARPPEPLTSQKPMDKTWRTWKQEFTIFLKAAGFDVKSSNEKACFFLNKIGKLGIEVMQDMKFDCEDDKQNYDTLLRKFDKHFDPPKNEVEERFNFYTRSRKNNESIDDYIADLKEKVKTCNFGHLAESLVRDVVIMDIKDKYLRKIIFEEKNLDLNKLIITYKQYELNAQRMKELSISKENISPDSKPQESNASANKKSSRQVCSKCGTSHAFMNCPAFHTVCRLCNERGHFAHKCKKNDKAAANNASINKVCWICKETGHLALKCKKNGSEAASNDSKKIDTKKDVIKTNNIFKDSKNQIEKEKNLK